MISFPPIARYSTKKKKFIFNFFCYFRFRLRSNSMRHADYGKEVEVLLLLQESIGVGVLF